MTNQAVNNVFSVRVVSMVDSLAADEVHDLMLSLTRDAGIRNVNLHLSRESVGVDRKREGVAHILPTGICVELLSHPVSQ